MARHQNASTRPSAGSRAHRGGPVLLLAAVLALAGCQSGTATPAGTASQTSASTSPSTAASPNDAATATITPPPTEAAGPGTTTIAAPSDGATVAGPAVTVSGTGTAFEGTLLYVVQGADGSSVRQGFTTAGANGTIGPFSFDVTLDPGTYTVEVWEPGMGEGDATAPPLNVARATFTVS